MDIIARKDQETTEEFIQQAKLVSKLSEKDGVIEVTRTGETSTRYTIAIIDSEKPVSVHEMKFVAFVVPLGKEEDWLFSSDEGRQIIRKNCHVDRLAMIFMNGRHEYPDLKGVKRELEDTILRLAPNQGTDRSEKVVFITMPTKIKVNDRIVCADGESKFSGKYAVEDVTVSGGERYRRMIFLRNGHSIQSEIRLKNVSEGIEEVDLNVLHDVIYSVVNVGIALAIAETSKSRYDVLLIGLGGGHLTVLIHGCFKNVWITAIEIEEEVYKLAKKYFGLKPDERMKIQIEDGVTVLAEAAENGTKYDAIVLVASNADPKSVYHCPPPVFLEPKVLSDVACCLHEKGLFLLTLGCRSLEMTDCIYARLRSTFAGIILIHRGDDNLFGVHICWKEGVLITEKKIEDAAQQFYALAKENGVILVDEIRDICKFVKTIHP